VTGDEELLRLAVAGEPDVFLVRQRGREVAESVGLESQDQIRVATALSDLGRDLVRGAIQAGVRFAVRPGPTPALLIELRWHGAPASTVLGNGLTAASRLMDEVSSMDGTGDEDLDGAGNGNVVVSLAKRLPAGRPPLTPGRIATVRHILAVLGRGDALDELRAQNQELLDTLEDLELKRRELVRVNEELEDTNRGVVALYKELTEELEQTNRGVVALYAELDEKTTALREAGEARTRFWSNISHELRSPINSVVGLARLLTTSGADPLTAEQRRQIMLINDSGSTLLALVNELLDTAKAESGNLVPQLVPADLEAVLLQLRGALQPLVRSGDVELVIDEPDELPPLVTDEVMLLRILRNLLSNGLKFTERGQVRLSVRADEAAGFCFAVTDTGIGIPDDQQQLVFEEFHQVPGQLQARANGTGLGLPYARRLAGILGGELILHSVPGEGTTVTLLLPTGDPRTAALPDIGTVLVVDDDPEFRASLSTLVGEFVTEVLDATDGRTALVAIDRHRPDLIFLDLAMPVMNGGEVLTVLRQGGSRGVPVVVTSSGEPVGLDLTESGLAAAFLPKSRMSAESVRHAVREAFGTVERAVRP
jgi:signal transduction histidine kinase